MTTLLVEFECIGPVGYAFMMYSKPSEAKECIKTLKNFEIKKVITYMFLMTRENIYTLHIPYKQLSLVQHCIGALGISDHDIILTSIYSKVMCQKEIYHK